MRLSARYFFCFIFSLTLFLVFPTNVFAQSPSTNQTKLPLTTNVGNMSTDTNSDVPNTLHNWTQNVMIEVMSAFYCQLTGVDPTSPKQACLGVNQTTGKIGFVKNGGGAIGVMGTMISSLYSFPLHTSDYFRNLAQNFGIVKKTYAQEQGGAGFQSLSPLLPIWSSFRDIVYIILVLAFVVIGIAIMLRIKIDPRTVMTIQNQIPKIIIGLLAVTFSFAISGFLIDMMWVLIYFIYGVIVEIPRANINVSGLSPSLLQNTTPFTAINTLGGVFGISNQVGLSLRKEFVSVLNLGDPVSSWNVFIGTISTGVGFLVGWMVATAETISILGTSLPAGTVAGVVAGAAAAVATRETIVNVLPWLIGFLVVFVALLVALFRLWFTLLMAYVFILLDVVLAPFWIIGGMLPGSQFNFTGWLKDIVANLLAFPTVIGMFLLGKVFMDAFGANTSNNQFLPPLIGGMTATSVLGPFIGLGIVLMTPGIVNTLKQMLKAPKNEALSGAGKAIGVGVAIPMSTGKSIGSVITASKEITTKSVGQDKQGNPIAVWGERGTPTALAGKLFGRG